MQGIKVTDPQAYDKRNAAHKCGFNYKAFSPAMGTVGAEKIFKQSVAKQNLHYTSFYGEGECIFYLVQYIFC